MEEAAVGDSARSASVGKEAGEEAPLAPRSKRAKTTQTDTTHDSETKEESGKCEGLFTQEMDPFTNKPDLSVCFRVRKRTSWSRPNSTT